MFKNIFIISFLLCVIALQISAQEKWIPFYKQERSAPSVNLTTSNNNNVSFTVQINGISVSDRKLEKITYQSLSFPEGEVISKEGSPQVPMITKLIAIPDCNDISISVIPSDQKEFKNYNIVPAPRYEKKKWQDGSDFQEEIFDEDKTVYSSSSDFPGKYGEIIETGYCRDQKVARIAIYPVQFNPVGKAIKVFTNFYISVSFTNPTSAVNKELGIFRNMMHHAALNYELSGLSASSTGKEVNEIISNIGLNKNTPASVTSGSVTRVTNLSTLVGSLAIPVDYLIITHSSLFNSSYLTTLANWRRDHNSYDVVICQVDAAGTNNDIYDFEDTPGHIKYPSTSTTRYISIRDFIQDVYLNGKANNTGNGHLGYICLVGDALDDLNTTVMLPAAYPPNTPPYYYTSLEQGGDYYYACLTSTGGTIDNDQDVMYGRISVGNETELSNVVSKITNYEANSAGNWNNNCTFVSSAPEFFSTADPKMRDMTNIVPPTISKSYAYRAYDYSAATLVTEANPIRGWRYTWTQYNTNNGCSQVCGAADLNYWLYTKLNSGIHTFVYEDHGGWNALNPNEGCGRRIFYLNGGNCCDGIDTGSVNTKLNNSLYSFMIFNCCDAGHLDHTSGDCVAEVVANFANKGAIGIIASSRDSNTGSFGLVDQYVIEAEYNHLSHVMGEAVMEMKLRLSPSPYNDHLQYRRQYNLYGDPALNLFPTGYTITENLTMSGNNTISENITVASGVTLTVSAGANLRFTNGAALTVNGTLAANGTSSSRVTLNFIANNNNGITVNSGGTANISYSDISNALNGIYFNQGAGTVDNCTMSNCSNGVQITSATPTIQYCTISNNEYGIKVTNSYSQSWTASNFSHNTITGNTSYGIYLYNSSPTLTYNTITGNNVGSTLWYSSNPILNHNTLNSNTNYGLACYGSASPNMYTNPTYSFGGNNIIRSNGNKGIVITVSSNPNIGNVPANSGGNNSIFGNTGYEVDNTSSNTILACRNYWGNANGPQTGDINGTVNTSYYLTSDPNPLLKMSTFVPSFDYDSTLNIPLAIQQANYEMIYNNYSKASGILKEYLVKEKFSAFGNMAAVLFLKNIDFYLDNKSSINEVEILLNSELSNNVRYELLSGLSLIFQKVNNNDAALNCLEKVTDLKLSREQNNNLLFQKAFLYMYSVQDIAKGKFYLNEIIKNNTDNSLDYQLALDELNSLPDLNNNQPRSRNVEKPDLTKSEIPNEYNLLGNFPNPFNPSTTLKYALPKVSNVELKIYDLMGREIKTLVSGNFTAGYKEVVWDGRNSSGEQVSSGIYLYRLVAKSLMDGKTFEKSAKLIMMK
ncbi:MAG: C25 family cysteine peptidase [Ignavibacteriales bacterium]|nr:C25 family cysteine peptidase [Ignavibacteriales bacterium]